MFELGLSIFKKISADELLSNMIKMLVFQSKLRTHKFYPLDSNLSTKY